MKRNEICCIGHTLSWSAIGGLGSNLIRGIGFPAGFQSLETDITHSAESGGFYNLKVELDD